MVKDKKKTKQYSKPRYSFKRNKNNNFEKKVANIAKKVSLQVAEPKQASQIFSSLTNPGHQTLLHNVTYYQTNLLKTEQGETANPGTNVVSNRIGNEIYAKGLKLRMQLINSVGQSNVAYKVFVFRYQTGKTMNDAAFWCGTDGTGSNMNRMLDFVDTREVTILKTINIKTAPNTANMNQNGWTGSTLTPLYRMHSNYRDLWIPINKKIKYDDNNSTTPKYTDLGVAVLAYDVNNTPQTTVLGYVDFVSRLYFRDP